jgi:hypothetical protein
MLPTPKGSAAGPDYAKTDRSKTGISLQTAVGMLPTPDASDAITHGTNRGLKLQPAFVEYMMGYPEGFTELTDLNRSEMQ